MASATGSRPVRELRDEMYKQSRLGHAAKLGEVLTECTAAHGQETTVDLIAGVENPAVGETALHMVLAAKGAGDGDDGWAGAVRELLQRHSDPMYLDARRKVDSSTALHLAVDGDACQARVVAGLVLRDANHAQKNKHGFTVLEWARKKCSGAQKDAVVKFLSDCAEHSVGPRKACEAFFAANEDALLGPTSLTDQDRARVMAKSRRRSSAALMSAGSMPSIVGGGAGGSSGSHHHRHHHSSSSHHLPRSSSGHRHGHRRHGEHGGSRSGASRTSADGARSDDVAGGGTAAGITVVSRRASYAHIRTQGSSRERRRSHA